MRLVKCNNSEIIMSVTKAADIHRMIAMSKALRDSNDLAVYVDRDGIEIVPEGFTLRLFNSNTPYAGKWAKEVYKEALAASDTFTSCYKRTVDKV